MRLLVPNNSALTFLLLFTAVAISSCNGSENAYDDCREQAFNMVKDVTEKLFSNKLMQLLKEGSIQDIINELKEEDLRPERPEKEEEE